MENTITIHWNFHLQQNIIYTCDAISYIVAHIVRQRTVTQQYESIINTGKSTEFCDVQSAILNAVIWSTKLKDIIGSRIKFGWNIQKIVIVRDRALFGAQKSAATVQARFI